MLWRFLSDPGQAAQAGGSCSDRARGGLSQGEWYLQYCQAQGLH